jgi:hypothetical protein
MLEERLRQQLQHKRQEHAALRYAFDLFSELVLICLEAYALRQRHRWRSAPKKHVCWRMLAYADITHSVALSAQEARMLAYADVC